MSLRAELELTRARLAELEEIVRAIRAGEVDALVVEGEHGGRVFTLAAADRPFREFVERMSDGAATVAADGTILWANGQLARILAMPLSRVLGARFGASVHPDDTERLAGLLERARGGPAADELRLCVGPVVVPTRVSAASVETEGVEVRALVVTDLSEERSRQREVQDKEALLRRILETLPVGVIVLDGDGEVTEVNAAARRIAAAASGPGGGSPSSTPLDDEPLARTREAAVRALTTGEVIADEQVEVEPAGGPGVSALVSAVPLRPAPGEITGAVAVIQDITIRRRAQLEVERLNEHLEERVRERTAELESFAYTISHDLRAPLRAIAGFSGMLVEDHAGQLDPEALRLLGVVVDNVAKMNHLIDELLALSRLSRVQLTFERVDMEDLVRSIVGEIRAAEPERSISVVIGTLAPAVADGAMIGQVWRNLIENAFKFTRPRRRARIEIASIDVGHEVVYRVRDNGVGFDPAYAEQIFGVFQRLHLETEFEGTGVGLAIARRAVARHGGRIWAEGVPDRGATFWFSLPRRPPTA